MIKDILRRLAKKILTGIVNLSYDSSGIQLLQVTFKANDTWGQMPHYQNYGFTHRPKNGAQAVGLFIDEDNGLVIAVDDRRYRLRGLTEGEVAVYDDIGNTIHLGRQALSINAVTQLNIKAPSTTLTSELTVVGNTTLQGNLTVTGNIKTDGTVTNAGKDIAATHGHTGNLGQPIVGVT